MQSRGQHCRTSPSSGELAWWLGVLSLFVLPCAQCKALEPWSEHSSKFSPENPTSVRGSLALADRLPLPCDRRGRRDEDAPLTPDPLGQRAPGRQLQSVEREASVKTFATSRPEFGAQTLPQPSKYGEKTGAEAVSLLSAKDPLAAKLPDSSLGRTLVRTTGSEHAFLTTTDIAQGEKAVDQHLVYPRGDRRDPSRPRRANVGIREAAQIPRHDSLHQHQEVRQSGAEPHASRMVLTAVSTLAAVVGVCVMAALFQCCCRKKRRGGDGVPADRGVLKAADKEQDAAGGSKRSRSKSPSPAQAPTKDEDAEDKGLSEQDKLLEDDEDLGDFSMVQRETEILRSYRKPPPPKNRARASRVPRALKTVEPNASPDVFQELVEDEDQEVEESTEQVKLALKPPPRKGAASDVAQNTGHSSMLDEIDSAIAAIHKDDDKATDSRESPPKEGRDLKEGTFEKVPVAQMDASPQVPRPKPRTKEGRGGTPRQEELTQSPAQELPKAFSKEDLTQRPSSKSPSPRPRSRDTSPKSQSSGSVSKLSSKGSSASDSTSMQSAEGDQMSQKEVMTSNGSTATRKDKDRKEMDSSQNAENVFALIDPTAGDKSKSKIPVRAGETTQGSAAAQPTVALRHTGGKELKRFPVPSVHGEKMDQLMKSLKTRLKEDSPTGKHTSKVSPEGNGASDLDPQSRERAYSDPTKQNAEKATCESEQTHL